jgi:hypothetical protein
MFELCVTTIYYNSFQNFSTLELLQRGGFPMPGQI